MAAVENRVTSTFNLVSGAVACPAFLIAFLLVSEPATITLTMPWVWYLGAMALVGWGGLVYVCWIRTDRIAASALAFVLAFGACGATISVIGLGVFRPWLFVMLIGTWILNGLGIVWIVNKVRRIRAASNTE